MVASSSRGSSSQKPHNGGTISAEDIMPRPCPLGIAMGSMESVSSSRSGSQATTASASTISSRGSSSSSKTRVSSPRQLPPSKVAMSHSASGRVWSPEQDEVLRAGALRRTLDNASWKAVSQHMLTCGGDFSPEDCRTRWGEIKELVVKGPWAPDEDALLTALVAEFGAQPKKWSSIAANIPGRAGKQCRERWLNHLDKSVKKGEWTEEEDNILCDAQQLIGNKWSEIAKLLPGRAENSVKNRFNSLITRRIAKPTGRKGPSTPPSDAELSGDQDAPPKSPSEAASAGASHASLSTSPGKATTTHSKGKATSRSARPKKVITPPHIAPAPQSVEVKQEHVEDQLFTDMDLDTLLGSLSSSTSDVLPFLAESYLGSLESTTDSNSPSHISLLPPPLSLPPPPPPMAALPLSSFLDGSIPLPPLLPAMDQGVAPKASKNNIATTNTASLFLHGLPLTPPTTKMVIQPPVLPPPIPSHLNIPQAFLMMNANTRNTFPTGFGHTPGIIRQASGRQQQSQQGTCKGRGSNNKATGTKNKAAALVGTVPYPTQQQHSNNKGNRMGGQAKHNMSTYDDQHKGSITAAMLMPDPLGMLTMESAMMPPPPPTGAGDLLYMPTLGGYEGARDSAAQATAPSNSDLLMRRPFDDLSMGSEDWSLMDPFITDANMGGGLNADDPHGDSLALFYGAGSSMDASTSSGGSSTLLLPECLADLGLESDSSSLHTISASGSSLGGSNASSSSNSSSSSSPCKVVFYPPIILNREKMISNKRSHGDMAAMSERPQDINGKGAVGTGHRGTHSAFESMEEDRRAGESPVKRIK